MRGARTGARVLLGLLALVAAMAVVAAPARAQAVKASYIYTLSSFTGAIPYNWSRVAVDRDRNEVYVLYENTVRIFNDSGMEVYHFGDDLELGLMIDVAVDDRGDILLLAYRDSQMVIVRCDYRGRPRSEIALKGLPADLSEFAANRLVFHGGGLYLASTLGLQVVVADREGNFKRGYDLFQMFELEEKDRGNVELSGFSVDRDGNILMTVPVLFRAFVLSPDGKLNWFGKPSSAPGGFNIVGGIAKDSKGNFVVIDKLKGAVLVFNPSFAFVTMFSTRGYKPGQLAYPDDLIIDGRDRVYVTQMGKRGVSVFKLAYTGG
jgi:DNA-binding beta-propeller fold protein YncE